MTTGTGGSAFPPTVVALILGLYSLGGWGLLAWAACRRNSTPSAAIRAAGFAAASIALTFLLFNIAWLPFHLLGITASDLVGLALMAAGLLFG